MSDERASPRSPAFRLALVASLAGGGGFAAATLLFSVLNTVPRQGDPDIDPVERSGRVGAVPELPGFDPERLLHAHGRADLDELRARAAVVAFGPAGLPLAARAATVLQDVATVPGADGSADLEVDRFVIDVGNSLSSTVEHLRPEHPTGVLVVVQQGHVAPPRLRDRTALALARAGHDVLVLSMPLKGGNPQPVVEVRGGDRLRLVRHDQMAWLDPPLRPFLEPVVVAISEGLARSGAQHVAMVGLSGGGWATVLCAALDPRIEWSCSVAGTLPLALRGVTDWGDFEQTTPEFLRVASYLDLYLLGADRPGRSQLHVYNAQDPCCFAGDKFRLYEGAVQARLASLGGGRHENLLDDTHEAHAISPWALDRIQAELRALAAAP